MKCGFTRIKLENEGASQEPFAFKIGDPVRSKVSKATGVVVAGDCYRSAGRPDQVFYSINLPDGKVWTLRQEDLERSPD